MLGSFLRDLPTSPAPSMAAVDPSLSLKDIPTHGGPVAMAEEEPPAASWMKDAEEFEVVMGRRQIASVSFVILVTLTVFSTVSYLAGRWTGTKGPIATVFQAASESGTSNSAPAPKPSAPAVVTSPVVTSPVAAAPAPAKAGFAPNYATSEITAKEPPIFGEPVKGSIYLQMGAVDKGMANVMVNGLRRLGFPSIISAGPNDRVFRVLVGPLADAKTAQSTGRALEAFGLNHFAKRIEDVPAARKAAPAEQNDAQ